MKIKTLFFCAAFSFVFAGQSQVSSTIHFTIAQTPCDLGMQPQNETQPEISIYPNPTVGNFTIRIKTGNEFVSPTLTITNMIGETILVIDERKMTSEYIKEIDLSFLPRGIYFIRVGSSVTESLGVFKIALIN